MQILPFEIPHELGLMGYKASISGWHDRGYTAWKRAVRLLANGAGVPAECGPGTEIEIVIRWRLKARIDGDNVAKGLVDALWRRDRALSACSWRAIPMCGEESARVSVSVRTA